MLILRRAFSVFLLLCGVLPIACSSSGNGTKAQASATAPPATVASSSASDVDYTNAANWLCRPGKTPSPCVANLDAIIRAADGSTSPEPFVAASDPKIDCFYVYPTVSTDAGANSDLIPGAGENNAALNQAARFAADCRLFAPDYRQDTLTDLGLALASGRLRSPQVLDLAYNDVLAAFQEYLARDNQGRGFVLIGHSQGSEHLVRLIKDQIDPNPQLQARLVSAIIIGGQVHVPANADAGGDFKNVPACRKPEQTGCVIAYSSFNASAPPPTNSFFGRGGVLCVNPAALAGGAADLKGYYPASGGFAAAGVTTPFVSPRGLVQGECVNQDGASYLRITAAPSAGIPANITGPQWGLHVLDVNLTLGDLVALVQKQAAAYASK